MPPPWIRASRPPPSARQPGQVALATSRPPLQARKWAPAAGGVQRNISGGSAGVSTVSASLVRIAVSLASTTAGSSTASGSLAVQQAVDGTAAGGSTASGLLGDIARAEGESHGSSVVTGELIVGQAQGIDAASAGGSTAQGDLSVRVKYRPTGEPTKPSGDDRPNGVAFGSGRDYGNTRRVFNPVSSGRVSSKSIFEMQRISGEFAGGE